MLGRFLRRLPGARQGRPGGPALLCRDVSGESTHQTHDGATHKARPTLRLLDMTATVSSTRKVWIVDGCVTGQFQVGMESEFRSSNAPLRQP